jgi:hypothetical protein
MVKRCASCRRNCCDWRCRRRFRIPLLLMRARAQATVRVWKKELELHAHWRFDIRKGCVLPVAAGERP